MVHRSLEDARCQIFGIADIASLKWSCGSFAQMLTHTSNWEHIVDNLDPKALLVGPVIQELLYEQLVR